MTKVYIICLDAFPEIKELSMFFQGTKFKRSELICGGAFTCATLSTMICGGLGTDIVKYGLGAHTTYQSNFMDWRRKGNERGYHRCIFDRLDIQGTVDIDIHNHIPWMSHNLIGDRLTGQFKSQHYRDHKFSPGDEVVIHPWGISGISPVSKIAPRNSKVVYSSCHPDLTFDTFYEWDVPPRKNLFYNNECRYISDIQRTHQTNKLMFTDLCHWHEAVYYNGRTVDPAGALKDMVNWLGFWNFDEPNAIFYIFADHSHRVEHLPGPDDYITWLYIKDNTLSNKTKTYRPVVSSYDFYNELENIFGLKSNIDASLSEHFTLPYDPKRIYWMQDGRGSSDDKTIANTFTACMIISNTILQVTLAVPSNPNNKVGWYVLVSSLSNKYSYTRYYFPGVTLELEVANSYKIECSYPLDTRDKIGLINTNIDPILLKQARVLAGIIHETGLSNQWYKLF